MGREREQDNRPGQIYLHTLEVGTKITPKGSELLNITTYNTKDNGTIILHTVRESS